METALKDFIRKTIEEINAGLPEGYALDEAIEFEVSIMSKTNSSGGIEIKVINGAIEKEKELVQTVNFAIINEKQKAKSDKKAANNIIKWIDKGVKQLNKYSAIENTEQSSQQVISK